MTENHGTGEVPVFKIQILRCEDCGFEVSGAVDLCPYCGGVMNGDHAAG